jgi:hypothetical protein
MMAYEPDSVNENQLLYEMARFNFTSFIVRNFDIEIEEVEGLHRMKISGFLNYDEVLQYARVLYKNESITRLLKQAHVILISEPNLELLGTHYSYNEYADFYEQHFIPLKISTVQLLTEPADIQYEEREEKSVDSDELLNGGVIDDNTLIDLGIEDLPATNGAVVLPEEQEPSSSTTGTELPQEQGIELPQEQGNELPQEQGIELPQEQGIELPQEQGIELPQEKQTVRQQVTGILELVPEEAPTPQSITGTLEIPDETMGTGKPSQSPVKTQKTEPAKKEEPEEVDEYFELEGF